MVKEESEHKAEILWESKERSHTNGLPFFSVKRARGYYIYGERTGINSIAFILYDKNIDKYCLINESKPPMDEFNNNLSKYITAFGGSIDSIHTDYEICKTEVLEETGYNVPLSKINYTGSVLVSTQMNQICHTFIVNVTNISKTHKAEYESTDDSVHWLKYNELFEIEDWKALHITIQAKYKNLI